MAAASLYVFVLVVLIAVSAPVVAGDKSEVETIVHQSDLNGWQVDGTSSFEDKAGPHPVWTVANGEVFCAGHGFGYLRYEKQLADFVVSPEFKAGPNTNSGIGLRGIKYSDKDLNTCPSIAGFEVQILDDVGKHSTVDTSGALYRYFAPRKNAIHKAGEWNRLVITCRGPKIVVQLNGEAVQDFNQKSLPKTGNKPLSGYLSLQNHGGSIVFRNIRLQELH